MTDLMEHITKVRKYMLKDHIKANTIIIDKEVAKVNGFQFLSAQNCITEMPTLFMGLKVAYEKELSEKVGIPVNFIMAEIKEERPKTPLSEYTTDELLEEIKERAKENEYD